MTNLFTVNQTPATPAVAMYLLKTQMKAAGWTVPRSSDGTIYNSSGDQISSGASGAGGMDNARAWFVIQQPGATPRQFCIQRQNTTGANTSQSWRIKYSRSAGFTGGSPAATVTPSAADENIVAGGGTDASPTFSIIFSTNDGTMRFHCFASDADPYGFMSWSWTITTALTTHAFGFDPVSNTVSGDPDPWIIHLLTSPGTASYSKAQFYYAGSHLHGYFGNTFYNPIGTAPNPGAGAMGPYVNASYNPWTGYRTNPYNNKDDVLPLIVGLLANNIAPYNVYKGFLTYARAIAQAGRTTGSLYTVNTTWDNILVNDVVLPWDGVTVPLI